MQRRRIGPALIRAIAGGALGLALWWSAGALYNRYIAVAAEALFRIRLPNIETRPAGGSIVVTRPDLPGELRESRIPASDLTINFVLLTTLFAMNPRPWRDRNLWRFAAASGLLALTHPLAFVAKTLAYYALRLADRYGTLELNFLIGLAHFYQLIGMYALALVLWWSLSEHEGP